MKHLLHGFETVYESIVDNCEAVNCTQPRVLADYTPTYLKVPFVSCRIKKMWPDARFVVVLRDPVDRAVSQYLMDVRSDWFDGRLFSAVVEE